MASYIFQSKKEPELFAFTADRKGSALPVEYSPWRLIGGQAMPASGSAFDAARDERIMQTVAASGFYLFRAVPKRET